MKLTAAKCPSCGADIEVDQNSDKTKCEFCGSNIIVEDAIAKYKVELSGEVTVKNLPQVESLLKVADRAYKNGDYSEALDKYDKVVDLDPDNLKSVLRKALCSVMITDAMSANIKKINDSLYTLIDINSKDKVELDNCASDAVQVLEVLENKIDNYFQFKIAPNSGRVNAQYSLLYDILVGKDIAYEMATSEALKKNIANSALKSCNLAFNKRSHYLNAGGKMKTVKVANPYYKATNDLFNKYKLILYPPVNNTPSTNNTQGTTQVAYPKKSSGLSKKDITVLVGCLGGAAVIGIIFFIFVALSMEPYYGDTYTFDNQVIEFDTSSKLYFDDGNGRKMYKYESKKEKNVYTITFDKYTFIYDNGLCRAEEGKCVDQFTKKKD